PDRIRAQLARFAPRGTLVRGRAQWVGAADSPVSFSVSSEFKELGLAAQDAMPGVRGVSGSFNATQLGGDLKLDARNAVLELPAVFVAPIAADVVRGAASWERVDGQTAVRIERLEFSNPDAAGTAAVTYRTRAQGPGDIDLNARLDRANPQRAWYYLPKQVHESTREWLRTGLLKGVVSEAKVKLTGDLAAFPFADGKGGQFLVTAKTRDFTLAYADHWPAFTNLDADVRFEGARLTIDAVQGRVSGAQLGKVRAEIPDLRATPPLLKIGGDFSGPMAEFARFIDGSPLGDWTGHFLEGAQVTGTGHLALKLDLLLDKPQETKVDGELTMSNARLDLPGVPPVSQVNGRLAFSERDLRARDLAVEIFGGQAKLTIERTDGRLGVTGAGTANLASLRREYPIPYSDRASGTIDWTIAMSARPDALSWVLESPLKGVAVDLPAPLGKSAAETTPLKVERRQNPAQPGEDTIVATYGKNVAVALHRKLGAKGADVDRALVSLGRAAERPDAARADRSGLWVRAEMPSLNADTWLALQRREPAAAARAAGDLEFQGADLDVGVLEALGRRFNALKVTARRAQSDWRLDLRGPEIAGTATWSAPDAGATNGRIVARLERLAAPAAGDLALPDAGSEAKSESAVANSWPDIDVTADSFTSKGRDLGRLEVVAQPRGAEWQIEKLVLANEGGRIDANGAWRALGRQQQTKLDVVLDVKEAGAFLTRFGLPDAVQGAATRIEGQLSWAGAPSDFDYPTLAGAFRINAGAGRFMKVEPGIGKLLGVLSLQALPRRITLDFKDIFSEGFAFDQVTGNVRIQNGVMTTDNLKLTGPAAKVDIAGDADLAKETQRLSVKVQPALSMSVSAGAALLFLANPIIGAAVGAGSLLAQKVLQDPLEQLFSYQYVVTGGWSDPVVTRSNRDGTATVANPSAEDAVTR
ncbi:MAG: TIGR02099 family protein, partial [Aromatoleum sp.]|nr:TIGR02099 family protein [Aromatoleum sp.]